MSGQMILKMHRGWMRNTLTRRSLLEGGALLAASALPLWPFETRSQAQTAFSIEISPGKTFRPVPIAIPLFLGEATQAQKFTATITNNLRRCSFLEPLDPKNFLENITTLDQPPQFEAWKNINAQFLLTGRVTKTPDGRLKVEFRLWDIISGQQSIGQQYVTDAANARRVAHIISDAVFTRITGEKGFFDTRIVFVDESGPATSRVKRLAIMDQDGGGLRYLTRGDEMVVTPRFSPSSQDLTYMAYGSGEPKVYLLNIDTGQSEVVGNFPGMMFSPRFSPDGQKIAMSLSQGSAANLFTMDLRSRTTTRLTNTAGIDTSPSFSPDGLKLVFESDRGGSQQIYVMNATGGAAQRISFGEGRYSTPVWSPKGDYIAFTRQKGGSFGIGVMKPDGSGERLLTEGFHNEGPTWAPNGLYLMFFRDPGGGAKLYMCDILGRAEYPVPTPNFASDPTWGPLLS